MTNQIKHLLSIKDNVLNLSIEGMISPTHAAKICRQIQKCIDIEIERFK